ncbi:MAG: HpsJ family protein [Cyanobacteria bacterium P01_H01_bin.15]
MNSTVYSPYTSLCLKVMGVIFIVGAFIDFITLAIPFNVIEPRWQLTFATSVVDRGIVPMLGIGFIVLGYWVEANFVTGRKAGFDLRLPAYLLASLLALLYLLIVPLHLNNIRTAQTDALEQISQQSGEAEQQLQQQFDQLEALAQDPQRLQQIDVQLQEVDRGLETGQFQGRPLNPQNRVRLQEVKAQLQNFKLLADDPQALEARLNELRTRLADARSDREGQAKTNAFKQGLRTGLNSLMLAVGYAVIGWFGLRAGRQKKASQPPAPEV